MTSSAGQIVATFGEVPLGASEFAEWLRYTERREIVREFLADRVILAEAVKRGWECTAADLQKMVTALRNKHKLFKAAEMMQWLAEHHLSLEDLEKKLELQFMRSRLIGEVSGPDQVTRAFAENRRQYDQARLARMIVPDVNLAEELKMQVEEGIDFAELATQHSTDDLTRKTGGEMGLVSRVVLPGPVEAAVFAAQPGSLVGPIAADGQFHLVRVYQLVIGELSEPLAQTIQQQLFDRWISQQIAITQSQILPLSSDQQE